MTRNRTGQLGWGSIVVSLLAALLLVTTSGCGAKPSSGTSVGVAVLTFNPNAQGGEILAAPMLCVEMDDGGKVTASISAELLEAVISVDALDQAIKDQGPFGLWNGDDGTYFMFADEDPDIVQLEQNADGWNVTEVEGYSADSNAGASPTKDTGSKQSEVAPAAEVEPEPESTIREFMDDTYGTCDNIFFEGFEPTMYPLPTGVSACLIRAEYSATSGLVLEIADEDGKTSPLFNHQGPYSGTILCPSASMLGVRADGPWSIRVAPVSSAPVLGTDSITGTGDLVLLYGGPNASRQVSHTGDGTFSVTVDDDTLIEARGDFQGTMSVPEGPVVVVIRADGDWAIEAE